MRRSVGLLAAIALTACFKGAPPPPTTPAETPRPAKRIAALGDPLGFLPLDAQVVAVIDFKELRGSSLWKRFEPLLRQRLGTYREVFKECYKFDPLATIRRVSLGVGDVKGPPHGVVVVQGFKRDQVMPCLEIARDGSQGKMTIDRGLVSVNEGGQHVVLTFADDTTMVIQFGPQVDATAFAATLDGGAPLHMEPTFTELQDKLDQAHPMWLIVRDGTVFSGQTAGLNARSFTVSARIADTAAANLRIRFDDPAQAATLASTMQAQLANLTMMVEEITATAEDTDLVMAVRMSSAQLDSLLTLIGPSLGIP